MSRRSRNHRENDNDDAYEIEREDDNIKREFAKISEKQDLALWKAYITNVNRFKGSMKSDDIIRQHLGISPSVIKKIRQKYDLVSPYRKSKAKKRNKKKKDSDDEENDDDETKTDTEEKKDNSSKKKKEKSSKSTKSTKSSKNTKGSKKSSKSAEQESTPKLDMNLSGGGPDDDKKEFSLDDEIASTQSRLQILMTLKNNNYKLVPLDDEDGENDKPSSSNREESLARTRELLNRVNPSD